jgi:hypothetical protein
VNVAETHETVHRKSGMRYHLSTTAHSSHGAVSHGAPSHLGRHDRFLISRAETPRSRRAEPAGRDTRHARVCPQWPYSISRVTLDADVVDGVSEWAAFPYIVMP